MAIDRLDREHPDIVLLVTPTVPTEGWEALTQSVADVVPLAVAGVWSGSPNSLSSDHHEWGVIDDTAEAARKPASATLAPGRSS